MDRTTSHYDFIIIGSGPGGSSVAHELAPTGARILVIERGDFIPAEPENWDPVAVFQHNRYKASETWYHVEGKRSFRPGIHYNVGGNSKMYGAALTRPRRSDFETVEHEDGISPAWPVGYDAFEPWYGRAETLMRVHGTLGGDPGEPPHSRDYPYPAVPHEPYVARLNDGLKQQGLFPFHLPLGIDLSPMGKCVRCKTCDAFPCQVRAKSDAETCLLQPALASGNVTLLTRSFVERLVPAADGRRIVAAEIRSRGESRRFTADRFIVACGAVNSAALLLRSATASHPAGIANRSGALGRHYMVHNPALLVAIAPRRRNDSVFQKTLCLNDWYEAGPHDRFPLGSAQLVGKVQGAILKSALPWAPLPFLDLVAAYAHEWWLLTEDLPLRENRIELDSAGGIRLHYRPTNRQALDRLGGVLRKALKRAGFPIILTRAMGVETTSHQAGTVRFGDDPATSVLDPFCRAHDVANLFVVDGGFFPSLPAMGPTLTIIAQGLRVADHIKKTDLKLQS